MNNKPVPRKNLIWMYIVEYFNPSEGYYTRPGPSGLGSWYLGPPLRTRIQRRQSGYYSKRERKPVSIDEAFD